MPNSQTSWYHFKTASSAPSASRAICLLPGLLIVPGFMQSQDSSSPKLANERDAPKKCELLELPFHVTFHLKSLRFIKKNQNPTVSFPITLHMKISRAVSSSASWVLQLPWRSQCGISASAQGDVSVANAGWSGYPLVNIQKSYWKWPFIVDFPIKHGDFP